MAPPVVLEPLTPLHVAAYFTMDAVLSAADLVKYICDRYHRGCFQIRNEWMVDRSALLIAAYTGEKGGTKNTVDYAARKGVQTVFVLR